MSRELSNRSAGYSAGTASTRIGAACAILAIAVLAVATQRVESQLATRVIAQKQTVRLGDPIIVSVHVTNQAAQATQVDRTAMAFDCFEVIDPDGKPLPYVGFDGQVVMNRVEVQPLSTITIADALDLTDKYLFQKPGRYSIRLSRKKTGLPDSPTVIIEVAPGQLSEFDAVVSRSLPICPDGWRVVKDGRGEVAPFGRARVPGFALHLCHHHMRDEAVLLWFTKDEAKVDPQARIDPRHRPRGNVEYLGRMRGLFVYALVGENTPPLWPTAIGDISRALQIQTESSSHNRYADGKLR